MSIPKACYKKCEWGPWIRGACNASCDEAFAPMTRKKTYTMEFKPGQEECTGESERVVQCKGLSCCHSQKVRLGDTRCDMTCSEYRQALAANTSASLSSAKCQNKCKCPPGYVLSENRTSCILISECSKCLYKGKVYEVS